MKGVCAELVSELGAERQDVYGVKNGEYESLDEGHKDLKGGEGDQASEGERPDDQQEAAERGDRQYGERLSLIHI